MLRSELLPDSPAIHADRERILLVLGNLIGNAIKYGPAGGSVEVRAVPRGAMLRFEVRDHGPGVPPELRGAIFDKYVRAPDAAPGGAGLGLFIAREIVRAHGGELDLDSPPDGGALFWFTVALAKDGMTDNHIA